MKNFKKLLFCIVSLTTALIMCFFVACDKKDQSFDDGFGGGGTVDVPSDLDNTDVEDSIENAGKVDVSDAKNDVDGSDKANTLSDDAVVISKDGDYYITGTHTSVTIDKKVTAHLFFENVTLNCDDGKAFSSKKSEITLTLIGENKITNGSDNAVHIKGNLTINGEGSLTVDSQGKNGIKVSQKLTVIDATLNVSAVSHAITAETIVANGAKINVTSAGKDGLHAECDYDYDEGIDLTTCVFTTETGFVSLTNVEYSCDVSGDGIQADTFVYIDGGKYDIKTTGTFVPDTAENRETYGLTSSDFRYVYSNRSYQKVDSDYRGSSTLYALAQGCKGIKVGEIEFDSTGDGEDDKVISDGNYSIMIKNGEFIINSTDDALHTNSGDLIISGGSYTIQTTDDGMHADKLLKVNGGDIDVLNCYEGLEGAYVEINGGNVYVVATDDGINAATDDRSVQEHIIIANGNVLVDAEGDGLDSNGTILISGGVVTVYGPTNGGNAGLDADDGILVTGGTLFVTSALGMIETPGKNSTQYVVSYASNSYLSMGTEISVVDSDGNKLLTVTLAKRCQSLIFSLAEFQTGKTYKLYSGDTLLESFTLSNVITTIGTSQGQGGFGGRPGGSPGGRPW